MDTLFKKLAVLRSDLVFLRQQDIQLLKQLISISETIVKLSKNRSLNQQISRTFITNLNGRRGCIGVNIVPPDTLQNGDTPLVRLQSVPNFCRLKQDSASLTSLEDALSSTEDLTSSHSDIESITGSSNFLSVTSAIVSHRRFSDTVAQYAENSSMAHTDDRCYEEILLRNIKLWKGRQLENDSVFL